MSFVHRFEWTGPSTDPRDEQFGDVVESTALDEADAFSAVLVGEPTDVAVIGRRGADRGPAALRESLAGTKTYHFDAGAIRGVGDLGDVAFLADPTEADPETPGEDGSRRVETVQREVRRVTESVHALDALPVFLGGDNSLTFSNAAPLVDRGSLGVVNLDAHLDVREMREDASSGTPYRQLYEAGLDAYACVGARHFETSTAYAEYVRERGGDVVSAETVSADLDAAATRALDAMDGVDAVYVSVDLDVLDATAAPGVSAPTPGGLSTRDLFRLVRRFAADSRVAGFEVVECAPPLDVGNKTAAAGARAVAHFLAGATEAKCDAGEEGL